MTPAELGRFVREDVPRIKHQAYVEEYGGMKDLGELLSALDCAMGVLREVEPLFNPENHPESFIPKEVRKLHATLRLILGEDGEGARAASPPSAG